MLDRTRRHQRRIRLLDLYGALLTEHQRRILHLAWEEDWSYGEIADREGVSRTAVYDIIRRTAESLDTYERKLRLDRERALRARSIDHVRRRLGTLERQVGALARIIEKTA
jgi:uncharacterized protein